MTTTTRRAARVTAAALAAALLGGCRDFLTSSDAINNPNNPTAASINQLLIGVETNQQAIQTGDPARTIAVWMQQLSGTDRQYFSLASYSVPEDFADGPWATTYQGGGLQDLRTIQQRADAAGDSVTAGIARVLEGLTIGTAADFWGDVPYSTALVPGKPATLDPQAQVYAAVQTVLSRAIAQLGSNVGSGPGAADLFYGGSAARWTAAAYTLKARYFLHTAERTGTAADGTPAFDAAAYTSALAAAQRGIATSAGDLRSYQSSNPNEQNLLYQFTVIARAGYLAPSDYFVNLLTARSDPRLTQYFAPGTGQTRIVGAPSGNGGPGAGVATFNGSTGQLGAPDYRQPIVTAAENQLIIAESNYRLGNSTAALAALNMERTAAGLTALGALSAGAAGLNEIMTEKYTALFLNPEIWNDYKRTCLPTRSPIPAAVGLIPSRFLYSLAERNTNPANIPSPTDQPPRNPNDPNPCRVGGVAVTD